MKFSALIKGISLGILWGHLPDGLIRCTRNISRPRVPDAPFKLTRGPSTGKAVATNFNCLGRHHIRTSRGPYPVSLCEIQIIDDKSFPATAVQCLHAISLGFPVVGDTVFIPAEKFLNPTVPIPEDVFPLLLEPWIGTDGEVLTGGSSLMEHLLDPLNRLNAIDSKLLHANGCGDDYTWVGERSHCRYVDHPESVSIRRDRGRGRVPFKN